MKKVFDGFVALQGGMNGGTISNRVPPSQYAMGVNITCRNGLISTRPPFIEIELESEIEGAVQNIQTGKFQGMTSYEYEGTSYIVFAVNGSVYLIDPVTETITDVTAVPGTFLETEDRLHFCQCERYMVVQDGTNIPLIIEGTASRKADQVGSDEVPTGTVMAYCHGRLFVKTDFNRILAGNIHKPNTVTDVLVFTETDYLAGGGGLYTPADIGQIIAMTWAQAYGEATGQGPLMVMCERGIASFNVSVPRLQWQDLPIMRIEPSGNGCASELCVVKMNEDLLFMSWAGIQDFALLNVEVASAHRVTNLNTEVLPFVKMETRSLRQFSHGVKFDDRLLYTSIGEEVTALNTEGSEVTDYRFRGLIALDFAPINGIASLGETRRPAYDGIWTGVHPMGLAVGIFEHDERCYVMGKDNDGINHLYELMKEQGDDKGNIQIECKLYTRGMYYIDYTGEHPQPVPYHMKRMIDGFLWINSFEGDVDFVLSSCPDNSIVFHEISTISVSAPMVTSDAPPVSGSAQPRAKEPFPAFKSSECEYITGRNAITGFEFQYLIEWAGIANLERLALSAEMSMERKALDCSTTTKVLTGTAPDNFDYDVEGD